MFVSSCTFQPSPAATSSTWVDRTSFPSVFTPCVTWRGRTVYREKLSGESPQHTFVLDRPCLAERDLCEAELFPCFDHSFLALDLAFTVAVSNLPGIFPRRLLKVPQNQRQENKLQIDTEYGIYPTLFHEYFSVREEDVLNSTREFYLPILNCACGECRLRARCARTNSHMHVVLRL